MSAILKRRRRERLAALEVEDAVKKETLTTTANVEEPVATEQQTQPAEADRGSLRSRRRTAETETE